MHVTADMHLKLGLVRKCCRRRRPVATLSMHTDGIILTEYLQGHCIVLIMAALILRQGHDSLESNATLYGQHHSAALLGSLLPHDVQTRHGGLAAAAAPPAGWDFRDTGLQALLQQVCSPQRLILSRVVSSSIEPVHGKTSVGCITRGLFSPDRTFCSRSTVMMLTKRAEFCRQTNSWTTICRFDVQPYARGVVRQSLTV